MEFSFLKFIHLFINGLCLGLKKYCKKIMKKEDYAI